MAINLIGLVVSVPRQVVLLGKSGEAKKHVFGSSLGCHGRRLPNSCLRVGIHSVMQ
jgi:hypothetical protein